jgi:hypothetical protein
MLISNWLDISRLPIPINLYDFSGGINIDSAQARMKEAPWPLVPHLRGLSFAPIDDLRDHFGQSFPCAIVDQCTTDAFLENGWRDQRIAPWDACNKFTDLARQALERMLRSRGLAPYLLADRHAAWWVPIDVVPKTKVSFRWDEVSGLRQLQGTSTKRNLHWHFGVSLAAMTSPVRHVHVIFRVVFTEDGYRPINDPARMHRLRRSFAKGWRNARWRDMMLAFLYWLANADKYIAAATSLTEGIWLSLPPLRFVSPISMPLRFDETEYDDETGEDEAFLQADRDDFETYGSDSEY